MGWHQGVSRGTPSPVRVEGRASTYATYLNKKASLPFQVSCKHLSLLLPRLSHCLHGTRSYTVCRDTANTVVGEFNRFSMGPRVSLSSKLVNPQTSTSPRFQMVRTYGRLCFRGVEESPLELGGSLGKGSCLLGALWLLSLLALAGHFFGRRRNARMRAELCRRSGGSHRLGWAGLDVCGPRNLGLVGRFFLSKAPGAGTPSPPPPN